MISQFTIFQHNKVCENLPAFSLESLENSETTKIREYLCTKLKFVLNCDGIPDDSIVTHVHQKKNYNVCVLVPPDVFKIREMLCLQYWKRNPDTLIRKQVPNFTFMLIIYLGEDEQIGDTSIQKNIREGSKVWHQMVTYSTLEKYYYFQVTFTGETTRKLKKGPQRLFAQLHVSSDWFPEEVHFVAQGISNLFEIHSHSNQYSNFGPHDIPRHCSACGYIPKKRKSLKQTVDIVMMHCVPRNVFCGDNVCIFLQDTPRKHVLDPLYLVLDIWPEHFFIFHRSPEYPNVYMGTLNGIIEYSIGCYISKLGFDQYNMCSVMQSSNTYLVLYPNGAVQPSTSTSSEVNQKEEMEIVEP